MEHKKYSIGYCSGATGFGWEQEYDRLDEFEDFINEVRSEYTAQVTVYDYSLRCFVFWKKALSRKPEKDILHDVMRDMRTTTRRIK